MTILNLLREVERSESRSTTFSYFKSLCNIFFKKSLAFFYDLWDSNVCVGVSPMKSIFQNSMRRSPEMIYLCGDRRAALVTWPLL